MALRSVLSFNAISCRTMLARSAFAIRQYTEDVKNGNDNGAKKEASQADVKDQEKDRKLSEYEDKYRRLLAEMENVRERGRREVSTAKQFAVSEFSKDLLEVADVLSLALSSIPKEVMKGEAKGHFKDLYEGVSLTEKQLLKVFQRHGLEQVDPSGKKFDPNIHQAVFEVDAAGKEEGLVAVVSKKGYSLNGRVLRPAQVGVTKKSA